MRERQRDRAGETETEREGGREGERETMRKRKREAALEGQGGYCGTEGRSK